MACSIRTLKFIVLICAIIYGFIGVLVIILSTVVLNVMNQEVNALNTSFGILIGLGVIMFFATMVGCVGVFRESPSALKSFAIILIVISILIAILATRLFLYKSYIKSDPVFEREFSNDFYGLFENREMADTIQQFLECCGIYGPNYWENALLPNSCCSNSITCSLDSENLRNEGCLKRFIDLLARCLDIVGAVTIVVVIFGVITMWFSLYLSKYLQNDRMRGRSF